MILDWASPIRASQPQLRKRLLQVCVAVVVAILLAASASFSYTHQIQGVNGLPIPPISTSKPTSKHAFVLFLTDYSDADDEDGTDDYYTATRVLLYQLLHAPSTGTQASIPVVILATHSVKTTHVTRLRASGADVRIVDRIKATTWMGAIETPRWRDIFTKLRAFELYEFEKVLVLDSDMLLVDRLDGIFSDPATDVLASNPALARPDEGPLPNRYMLSAQIITNDTTHSYPPVGAPYFSGGFFLCHPNAEMVKYYDSLMQVRDRFPTELAEQDFLNYAHRKEGPMPWQDFDYRWTTTWPSLVEYSKGAKSLHEKWWKQYAGGRALDPILREQWAKAKSEMEVRDELVDQGAV